MVADLIKESIMNQYVIYKHPNDHPKKYVTRKWGIQPGGLEPLEKVVCNTLKEARDIVPKGWSRWNEILRMTRAFMRYGFEKKRLRPFFTPPVSMKKH